MRRAWILGVLILTGCAALKLGKGERSRVVLKDFAEERIVQVGITERLSGSKELLFVSLPKKTLFLEGYIQGIVTDYDDNPIQGVVVRAVAQGEEKFVGTGKAAFQTSSFDAGVSDTNGVYRIRFSLPLVKSQVDIRGKLLYNPGWEQELANLGKTYEPQAKETPFRLFFDHGDGTMIFSEGVRKTVVRSRSREGAPGKALPGAAAAPAADGAKKEEEDLFKGFGFGP